MIHLNYKCKVAKVAIPLSMLHRIMQVWWQSKFTAALQGRTQDSRIWEQLCTCNKQVHLFLHSTMTMEAQKVLETLNSNNVYAHPITQKALSRTFW